MAGRNVAPAVEATVTIVLHPSPESADLSARVHDLGPLEQQRWASFRREPDRRRYLSAHLTLRDLLAERFGTTPGAVRLGNDPCPLCRSSEHGRPISLDDPYGTHWSISHADGLAAVAVADTPVGIDVEGLARASTPELVTMLHAGEARTIADMDTPLQDRARLACWVRTEAVLKVAGTGLGVAPDSVLVGPSGNTTSEVDVDGRIVVAEVTDLAVGPGHLGALAITRRTDSRISGPASAPPWFNVSTNVTTVEHL